MLSITEFLTPIEAGDYLKLSASTLAKLRLYGGGPRYLKPVRKIVYRKRDLDEWMAAKSHASTSEYRRGTA